MKRIKKIRRLLVDETRIRNYVIWYIQKFPFVSVERIRDRLYKKFILKTEKDKQIIDNILNDLKKNVIDEKGVIDFKVREYLDRGKDFYYIKQQLKKLKFPDNLIDDVVNSYITRLNNNRYLYYDIEKLRLKARNYLKKGYGKNVIVNKLANNKQERSIVTEIVNEETNNLNNSGNNILLDNIKKYIKQKKIDISNYNDKQKVIKYFLNKGFKYNEIKETLNSL